MSNGPDDGDNEFGSELRRLASPRFARQQRRQAFGAATGGLVLGLMCLVLGIDSMRTGKWVVLGREVSGTAWPGWVVLLIGLFLLFLAGWIFWRAARRT